MNYDSFYSIFSTFVAYSTPKQYVEYLRRKHRKKHKVGIKQK